MGYGTYGYDDETSGYGYETMGDDGYATVGQMVVRPGQVSRPGGTPQRSAPQQPMRQQMPMLRPQAMLRPGLMPMPGMPGMMMPGGAALSDQRVRQIVAEELRARVPYGDVPTRPLPDEAMFPMGLGSATLNAATPTVTLTAQPQRAFRGERLVLAVQRSAGAAGVAVLLSDFTIGDYKQLVGGGSLPADVFASDAFGVRLMLDASIPGVLYSITLSATVAGADSIIVSGAVIGRAGEAPQR